VYVWQ